MVKTKILVPAQAEINRLRRLAAPLRIYEPVKERLGGNTSLLLRSNADLIRLSVEYADVVFKFEIFDLVPEIAPVAAESDHREMAVLRGWDTIRCAFAVEWERPALKGEVSPAWEQIVRERGLRSAVPDAATAVGISMVGIVFHNSVASCPVAMIYMEESDPCALLLSRDVQEIVEFISNCEMVTAEDFPGWARNLAKWCKSLTTAPRRRALNPTG